MAEDEKKREKKLDKSIEGTVITIKEGVTAQELMFDFSDLPADIQAKLGPFGLGHKLGDAAAGKKGQEAVDSIYKVWTGLVANDWSVRAPAGERVSKESLFEKVGQLSEEEQAVATALLAKLGIIKKAA